MPSFDREHSTSYLAFIETNGCLYRFQKSKSNELFVESRKCSNPAFTWYTHCDEPVKILPWPLELGN